MKYTNSTKAKLKFISIAWYWTVIYLTSFYCIINTLQFTSLTRFPYTIMHNETLKATLNRAHCTGKTSNYTWRTAHNTLHTPHCPGNSAHSPLHIAQNILHRAQCTLFNTHCTGHTSQGTLTVFVQWGPSACTAQLLQHCIILQSTALLCSCTTLHEIALRCSCTASFFSPLYYWILLYTILSYTIQYFIIQ